MTTLIATVMSVAPSTISTCSLLSSSCSSPLGLESGLLPDSQLSASSSYSSSVSPQMGRLNSVTGGGAWCPAKVVNNKSREWLEVDLGSKQTVTGVITQGRWDRGLGQEFAQHVMLQYWVEEEGEWQSLDGRREANKDTFTPVVIALNTLVRTNRVRIVPVSHHPRTVCLRMEVCGCMEEDNEVLLKSEDIPGDGQDIIVITTSYMSLLIGVLVTIIIILATVIAFILYKNCTTASNDSSTVPKREDSYQEHQEYQEYSSLPPDSTSQYTDSSTEYSSPLLGTLLPPHNIDWDTFFPPPPPKPLPSNSTPPVFNTPSYHYAASNIIHDRDKRKGHFLWTNLIWYQARQKMLNNYQEIYKKSWSVCFVTLIS